MKNSNCPIDKLQRLVAAFLHAIREGEMRSYEAARGLFSFMAVIAWLIIAGGVIAVIAGVIISSEMSRYGRGPGPEVFLFMLPGVGIGLVGVLTLAFAQIGRAGVDTAEYSQQMLQLSRESLEVSRQSLRQSEQMRTSFESLKARQTAEPLVSYAGGTEAPTVAGSPPTPSPVSVVSFAGRANEVPQVDQATSEQASLAQQYGNLEIETLRLETKPTVPVSPPPPTPEMVEAKKREMRNAFLGLPNTPIR